MAEENKKKMTLEVAEKEFDRFVQEWDIDGSIDTMSGEDREAFKAQKDRIVRQILEGNATVDEHGNIAYTLRHPQGSLTELKFNVPNGAAYMAMDRYKERQGMHKLYAFMGESTSQPPALFSNMDGRDIKFCMGVTLLFLGS